MSRCIEIRIADDIAAYREIGQRTLTDLAAAAGMASEARAARAERLATELFAAGGGCRGIALDPPRSTWGRSIIVAHERPRRWLFRSRCFCGETKA